MLSEQTQTQPQWADLSGRVLEGGYEIEDLLEADRDRAKFKIRVLGDRSVDAFVHLLRTGGTAADERLALWDSVHKLSHPNLHVPLAAGRTELEGVELIYTVLRKPDETLSGALRNRALNAKEAGEVLVSIARALERLHENRLLHGCVSPEQIVAFGDSIQLTSECVRPIDASNASQTVEIVKPKYLAPESSGTNTTPAADVWCLGATLFEVLTQKDCGAGCLAEADALPMPFSRVAQRCLASDPENRCTLSEVMALYKTSDTPTNDHSAAPPRPTRMARAVPELARIPEVSRATPQARERTSGSRAWIAWVIAAVVVFFGIWILRAGHASPRTPAAPPAKAAVPVPSAQTATAGKAWETRTLPDESAPKKSQPANPEPSPDAKFVKGNVWRVVLFTYDRVQDAQNRAQALNSKHPDLHADVFSPNGQAGPYLVTVGGRLSREDAERLRRKAVSLGMPHDSYIQNYRQ